jgi:hypothetical protein
MRIEQLKRASDLNVRIEKSEQLLAEYRDAEEVIIGIPGLRVYLWRDRSAFRCLPDAFGRQSSDPLRHQILPRAAPTRAQCGKRCARSACRVRPYCSVSSAANSMR